MAVRFTAPRRLDPNDRLDGFDCGIVLIDEWLETRARTAEKQGTAAVYVTFGETGDLAGFYLLSAYAVEHAAVAGGWLRRNTPEQIPAILLGMLGVDHRFQGKGLGRKLLHDAVVRALNVSRDIGARALMVDPVDDAATRFYEKNGFQHVPGSDRMFFKLA
ncbi:GNAT family N-acetyltransferase [Bifidobacterium biavatii]|uniref:Acetyltransferase n=1 Tax=Bifidobacterium biavatii DSM 23969 TaxID=1437608 RepID=A0A086ZN33_9BIFI|nr:GNAT family N-acetyltransferase [Bifidobacterium biavatii]KFI47933.1 acetyltransferase [Bifidobacterium biavatii DSM 23969]